MLRQAITQILKKKKENKTVDKLVKTLTCRCRGYYKNLFGFPFFFTFCTDLLFSLLNWTKHLAA